MDTETQPASWSDAAFLYVGGDAALDLVNTVDWTDHGLENDRLGDYARLVDWAERAGAVGPDQVARLRTAAARHPRRAAAALRSARSLRRLLRKVFLAAATDGEIPAGPAADALNRVLAGALGRLRLGPPAEGGGRGPAADWHWEGEAEALDSVLWPVAEGAARLLTSEEAAKIRVCAGEACGWMFVDRSRNGLRRWCQMETCGTRAKSRRRARRRAAARMNRRGGEAT